MDRSQKKSVLASTGLHLSILLLVLLVGPGFRSPKPTPPELPPLNFIPIVSTDTGAYGGGTPKPSGSPAVARPTPPAVTPLPPVAPPKATVITPPPPAPIKRPVDHTPAVSKPIKKPSQEDIQDEPDQKVEDPVEPVRPTVAKNNSDSLQPKPTKPPRHTPKIAAQVSSREDPNEKEAKDRKLREEDEQYKAKLKDWERQKAAAEAADRAAQLAADRLHRIANDIATTVNSAASDAHGLTAGLPSSSTSIQLEGPSGGGVPYGNFLSGVQAYYERDWRPRVPRGLADSEFSAVATVTILRDGTVHEARITRSSGNRKVDESVNETLNSVRRVVPLPEKAKEDQRTITIEFNVKPKLSLG